MQGSGGTNPVIEWAEEWDKDARRKMLSGRVGNDGATRRSAMRSLVQEEQRAFLCPRKCRSVEWDNRGATRRGELQREMSSRRASEWSIIQAKKGTGWGPDSKSAWRDRHEVWSGGEQPTRSLVEGIKGDPKSTPGKGWWWWFVYRNRRTRATLSRSSKSVQENSA